jgi:hypothetical protein
MKEIKLQKAGRPKGFSNRNPLTVRLALNSMGFDVVKELVYAIQQLDDVVLKVKALENLMKYLHPTIKEIELTPSDILEMEQLDIQALKPADIPTEELLEQVKPKEIE